MDKNVFAFVVSCFLALVYLLSSDYLQDYLSILISVAAILFVFIVSQCFSINILSFSIFIFLILFLFLLVTVKSVPISLIFLLPIFISSKDVNRKVSHPIIISSLLLLIFSLMSYGLVFEPFTYTRYENFEAYLIPGFFGTTPQQFAVLTLSLSMLITVVVSQRSLVQLRYVFPLLIAIQVFLLLSSFYVYERYISFLLIINILICISPRTFKSKSVNRFLSTYKITFTELVRNILLAFIIITFVIRVTSLLPVISERFSSMFSSILFVSSSNLYRLNDDYSSFYDFVNLLLRPESLFIAPIAMIVIYKYFLTRLSPLFMFNYIVLLSLIFKNSGRFNDPSVILFSLVLVLFLYPIKETQDRNSVLTSSPSI